VLLLRKLGLVKSIGFRDHNYIGDPINAVHIYNSLKADELVFLDIDATALGKCISPDFVRKVGEEASMPFSVGGGVRTIHDIRQLIQAGAERVVIGSEAVARPEFIREATEEFGSSSITVCMDVKKQFLRGPRVHTVNGSRPSGYSPVEFARHMADMGAGELIVQSIALDGTMKGYDVPLVKSIAEAVAIPVVALGGAGELAHMKQAYTEGFANGLAAGSMFVYHGKKRGVLINYPERKALNFAQ
jgi:cyclase